MIRYLKIIFCFCLLGGMTVAVNAQTVYHYTSIYAGVSYTPVPVPFAVNQTTGTTIFEGEYEIVLGPDCIAQPSCATSNNEFSALGFYNTGSNFFLARLVPPVAYADLKKQLDGSYCETVNKKLSFKYVEKYVEGTLNYQIYDYQRNPKVTKPITIPGLILSKKVGDNFFTIDLSLIASFVGTTEAASFYTLEVTNEKNEKTILRFRYSPNE